LIDFLQKKVEPNSPVIMGERVLKKDLTTFFVELKPVVGIDAALAAPAFAPQHWSQ
jgi:hypothetical protein